MTHGETVEVERSEAMSGCLQYGWFKWIKNFDYFDVNSISQNSPIDYILEVDLEYTDEFHAFHNDYPLTPKKLEKKIVDEYRIKAVYVKKLIPNLGKKTNYVLHYRNLQLYLSLGMKLTKIQKC